MINTLADPACPHNAPNLIPGTNAKELVDREVAGNDPAPQNIPTARQIHPFSPQYPLMVDRAMILCVTLNPCLDKTLTVPDWQPGANVRATEVHEVVGGKGNNVARALRRLGHAARPVTFLGGAVGQRCAELWDADLDPIVIESSSPTREIVTVRAPEVPATAFFDPDPTITPEEAEALLHRVDAELARGEVRALTLSGSSPSPATHGVYSDLIALAASRGVPAFLDTYGPALDAIWGFYPTTISLNRREAGLLLGHASPTDHAVADLLERWSRRGVRVAVVTDGPGDVLARIDGQFYRVSPPQIDPVNPIGSGDSLVAGLVDAHLSGLDPEATLRHAVAAAVSNALVWDAGAIDPVAIARLEPEVKVEPI